MDEVSVADLLNCPSPTKKKHRSSPVTEETTTEQDDENSVGEEVARLRTTRRRHSMVSTNLGTRFESVIEQEHIVARPSSSQAASPDTPTMIDTVHHTQEAPLDPQYKETGPAGADAT